MINLNHHIYRCGPNENYDLSDEDIKNTDKFREEEVDEWMRSGGGAEEHKDSAKE